MPKKQKKSKPSSPEESLLQGLDYLQGLAIKEEEKAYARRHTDFQQLAEQASQPEPETDVEGGEKDSAP